MYSKGTMPMTRSITTGPMARSAFKLFTEPPSPLSQHASTSSTPRAVHLSGGKAKVQGCCERGGCLSTHEATLAQVWRRPRCSLQPHASTMCPCFSHRYLSCALLRFAKSLSSPSGGLLGGLSLGPWGGWGLGVRKKHLGGLEETPGVYS